MYRLQVEGPIKVCTARSEARLEVRRERMSGGAPGSVAAERHHCVLQVAIRVDARCRIDGAIIRLIVVADMQDNVV